MAYRPTVAFPLAMQDAGAIVTADQAVFTSLRTPTGRGYRLIAASAGLNADEKREIVQRAPSHESLCDASLGGEGLASFVLQSGRRCVLLSRNAGAEHSARGGFRVHTHVIVLDPAAYRARRCDPLLVAASAEAALGAALWDSKVPQVLRALSLNGAPRRVAQFGQMPRTGDHPGEAPGSVASVASERCATHSVSVPPEHIAAHAAAVLRAVLSGRAVLVGGADASQDLLRLVLAATPAAIRAGLSLSCGLRFAPSRAFEVVLASVTRGEAERLQLDYEYEFVDSGAARDRVAFDVAHDRSASGTARDHGAPPAERAPLSDEFGVWLSFARRCWRSDRLALLDDLSLQFSERPSPADLSQVVALHDDVEHVADADAGALQALSARYVGFTPHSTPAAALRDTLQRAIAERVAALQAQDTP